MPTKKFRWFLFSIIILLFLAGCDCDEDEINAFVVTADTPSGGIVVTSNPTFTWHESESCTPDRFKLWVHNIYDGGEIGKSGFADGSDTSYTAVTAMDPGKRYTWYMYAVAEDQAIKGVDSEKHDFYVGPMCSGQPLIAPTLMRPTNDLLITDPPPIDFTWEYQGGCLPSSYLYQFATDIAFTDIVDTGVITDHTMEISKSFPDCSTLWWRVAASDGISTGPWSSPRAFHLANSSSCPQIEDDSINTARLSIHMFADDCPDTGLAPSSRAALNPGCVVSSGGLIQHGDGEDLSEPFFWEYVAQLGSGACPSTGLDEGTSSFLIQTPGVYCVSISKAQTASLALDTMVSVNLQNGMWTEPFSYNTVAEVTVEFGPGSDGQIAVFGWDKLDNLFPMPRMEEPKNCRFGPEPDCPIYDIPMMGAEIPIFARDAKSEWKLSEINDQPCYILLEDDLILKSMAEFGEPNWQIEDLPIFPEPDPCPPPVSESTKKTCSDYSTRDLCSAHSAEGCSWNHNGNVCDGP